MQTGEADVAVEVSAEAAIADVDVSTVVEAILFSTDVPLSARKLANMLGVGSAADVVAHIDSLNETYDKDGRSFRIECIANGYQMLTRGEFDVWVKKLHKSRADSRLSAAALETLAIVAYKQPILRADVESIRGVAAGDMLVRLREVDLVKIVGRAEEIGRPMLYGTTTKFLTVFGLASVKDLPKLEDGRRPSAAGLQAVSESLNDADTVEITDIDASDEESTSPDDVA